ncbi:MAG: FHA domain-containing protein [Leptospira sp.]|nr:FHA domain-containing protein [Leptospira sp.]
MNPQPSKSKTAKLRIEVLSGNKKGVQVTVEKLDFTLGRKIENEISLEGDDLVSGKHIRFYHKTDGWFLEDLQSTNGTISDGRKVVQSRIAIGQIIELGFGGPRLRLTPYSPEQERALGGKGTEYIVAIVASNFVKRNKVFRILLGILGISIIGTFSWVFLLNDRVSLVESKVKKHDIAIAKIEDDIRGLSAELEKQRKNQTETVRALALLKSQFGVLATRVASNTKEIQSITQRLDELPNKITIFQKRVEDFSNSVLALNKAISKRESEVFSNSEEEVRELSEKVMEDFQLLETDALSLGIDVDYLRLTIERASEPGIETSDIQIVDTFRAVHVSLRKTASPIKTCFTILKSLVDNEIVLTVAPIVKKMGVTGPFSFLI